MGIQVKDMDDFNNQLKQAGSKLVVVDFYATWCGPCKNIAPAVEQMAGEFTDVVFLKVDVDEAEDIASRYEISCMPTFLFLKNCDEVGRFSGASEAKLKEKLQSLKWVGARLLSCGVLKLLALWRRFVVWLLCLILILQNHGRTMETYVCFLFVVLISKNWNL